MATSNICRGISLRSRSTSALPRSYANSRWTISERASNGSPPAAVLVQLHDRADELLRDDDRRLDVGLLDLLEGVREIGRRVHLVPLGLVQPAHAVGDVRRRDEQVEVELALQALAHDLHVQQA